MTIALNEMDMDFTSAAGADTELLDAKLNAPAPTAELNVRSRRELERYMEDRALERELNADDWWD